MVQTIAMMSVSVEIKLLIQASNITYLSKTCFLYL